LKKKKFEIPKLFPYLHRINIKMDEESKIKVLFALIGLLLIWVMFVLAFLAIKELKNGRPTEFPRSRNVQSGYATPFSAGRGVGCIPHNNKHSFV
jgi:hypothetical protein